MTKKTMIAFFSAALALACCPAIAANMPPDGSKNFSPPGDTPAYFANEDVAVSGRVADTTAVFDSADDAAAAAVQAETGYAPSVHARKGRHSKFGAAHGSAQHGLGKVKGQAGSTRFATARISPVERGAAKPNMAKHSKASARHAAAATSHRG